MSDDRLKPIVTREIRQGEDETAPKFRATGSPPHKRILHCKAIFRREFMTGLDQVSEGDPISNAEIHDAVDAIRKECGHTDCPKMKDGVCEDIGLERQRSKEFVSGRWVQDGYDLKPCAAKDYLVDVLATALLEKRKADPDSQALFEACRTCPNRQPSGAENSAEIGKRLRRIGETINSRPVMGHWPHMLAYEDQQFLNQLADQLEGKQ